MAFTEACWDCDGDGHIHDYDDNGNETEDCPDAPECRCCEGSGFHTYDALPIYDREARHRSTQQQQKG